MSEDDMRAMLVEPGANILNLDANVFARNSSRILDAGKSALGSRYDEPLERGFMNALGDDLEKYIQPEVGFRKPLFGTSPLSSPNAMVFFHKPSKRHIIVFQRGLHNFFIQGILALIHGCPIRRRLASCSNEDLHFELEGCQKDNLNRAYAWLLEATVASLTGDPLLARKMVEAVMGCELSVIPPASIEY